MQKLIIQVWVLVSLAVISNGYASNLELSTESKNFYESCLNMSEDLVFNGSYQYLCEFKGQKLHRFIQRTKLIYIVKSDLKTSYLKIMLSIRLKMSR